MGGQRGSSANRERLKELGDMIRICTSQIRRYKHVEEHCDTILASYDVDIKAIKFKKSEVAAEYADAPTKLISLRRQLDKFRAEQDKITGHVTGRTKLVEKYKKIKAQLADLEEKLSDSGLDVDDICVEPNETTGSGTGDEDAVCADDNIKDGGVSEYFQDKIS